jgi:hypothetical protein
MIGALSLLVGGMFLTTAGTLSRLYGNGNIHRNECIAAEIAGLFVMCLSIWYCHHYWFGIV